MWKKKFEIFEKYPVTESNLNSLLADENLNVEVVSGRFLKLSGTGELLSPELFKKVMWDDVLQVGCETSYNPFSDSPNQSLLGAIEVGYLPGVTDNSGKALEDAFSLFLNSETKVKCFTGQILYLSCRHGEENGKVDEDELLKKAFNVIKDQVGNKLIQKVTLLTKADFLSSSRFSDVALPEVHITHDEGAYEISLALSHDELVTLSKDRCLALSLEEMLTIKNFYENETVISSRREQGLPTWPTDVELEVLAQTWSEHCKHKIFAANIEYTNTITGETESIQSLYKSYIKQATKEIKEEGKDWLISVFSDNAGIVRFDKKIDLCIKAETHNSPSALDPYGGAITGILGVNRDILGCGLGAKPIANTDVFCLGSTELPKQIDSGLLPAGLMEPMQLLRGVHKGVEDGGNKSGIPTVNGAIFFDNDYAGKPLVFCGTVGTLPQRLPDGRDGSEKGAKVGDDIFVIGGAVGADGIHGATFSSMELNEDSPATAVQIGDPITQKRVMDFLLRARDLGLYTCITDNGAGGISSSIGEMAELTGGALIDLDKHPRKYPGLSPWEIMISESQERMTCAVDPSKSQDFLNLAANYGVEVSCLGKFTDSGSLRVYFKDHLVADLSMSFLHDGVPTLNLKAVSKPLEKRVTWHETKRDDFSTSLKKVTILGQLLNRENIASKAPWVRQYDHEVQGATIGKPFSGKNGIGPGDSGVIDLSIHGGEDDSMVAIGCGLAPRWSARNSKMMAKLSVDEAVRNIVVSGINPEKICLLDNFCWPDPVQTEKNAQGELKLGMLVDTCKGLYEVCREYGAPLVSGKDSMKNDFRGKNRKGDDLIISIQPTLLVTSMGHGKSSQIVRSSASEGVTLYKVGVPQLSFHGSELAEVYSETQLGNNDCSPELWDFEKCFETYKAFYRAVEENLISCAHDVSDGGMLTTVAEMLLDEGLGLELEEDFNLLDCFGEGPGMLVVGVKKENAVSFEGLLKTEAVPFKKLGTVSSSGVLSIGTEEISTASLRGHWERNWGI